MALIAVGLNAPWTHWGREDSWMGGMTFDVFSMALWQKYMVAIIGLEGKRSSLLVVCMIFVLFLQQR